MESIDAKHIYFTPIREPDHSKVEPARPSEREKKLAVELETRIASSLEQIRARLNGTARKPFIDNASGTGNKLDILA
ncbi:MAG TPA: hypothetical protein VNJ09_05855 [Chthonomonadales bacterium]|nr:hypothetical protein [Chthonomonadales bacterium]